jgi:GNAT superfamily N-acetyltransferase
MAEAESAVAVQPVQVGDLLTITRMVFANMTGVDRQFTEYARSPLFRRTSYLFLPFYFLTAGRGFKVVIGNQIAGCAYVHLRQMSAYVFNVNVNRPFRRRGVARRLMTFLEELTRSKGLPWMALQVDDGNTPAQNLYRSLGYHPYCPHFLRREDERALPASLDGAVRVAPAGSGGRFLFERYAEWERQAGDRWAARVVGRDYATPPLPGGRYWRCLLGSQEIGAAWSGGPAAEPAISLALRQEYWGHAATAALVADMVGRLGLSPATIDLHLGSSAHYQAAAPVLHSLGFSSRIQSRILMLKLLE